MSAAVGDAPSRGFMSIGEVLSQLREEFPDVTISKIRFLEDEGLVKPERKSSGYRQFSRADVGRLRYVLGCQRDQYLPLRVIKEHLDAIDRGLDPPSLPGGGARVPTALAVGEGLPTPDSFRVDASEIRLSRGELLDAADMLPEQLDQLEQYGLLAPQPGGTHYDGDALVVARTVSEMARFGIEARHLRPFKAAADREIGLLEQVVTPMVRQRSPEARARADEAVRELCALSVRLHTSLVRRGLSVGLRR